MDPKRRLLCRDFKKAFTFLLAPHFDRLLCCGFSSFGRGLLFLFFSFVLLKKELWVRTNEVRGIRGSNSRVSVSRDLFFWFFSSPVCPEMGEGEGYLRERERAGEREGKAQVLVGFSPYIGLWSLVSPVHVDYNKILSPSSSSSSLSSLSATASSSALL